MLLTQLVGSSRYLNWHIPSITTLKLMEHAMKTMRYLLLAAALLVAGCSPSEDSNPAAPAALELQAEQNQQILAKVPAALRNQIPQADQIEVRAGRLFIWYLQGQGTPPDFAGRCAPLATISATGSGIATHLGHYTDVQSHCLDFATLQFSEGFATFTSVSSGDDLHIPYWGVLVPTADPALLKVEGNTTFAGGTGKFANASGRGIARGILNANTGALELVGVSTLRRHHD